MHIDRLARLGILGVLTTTLVSACGSARSMSDGTLASCASCHGGVDNDSGAPPNDLNGDPNGAAVGAHTTHVDAGITCDACHAQDENHPDGQRSPITFGGLALAAHANPVYDPATMKCSGVYCHGATLQAGGTVPTPQWNQDLARCLICHAYAPASHAGYANPFDCSNCHSKSIEADDMTLKRPGHLNGELDFN